MKLSAELETAIRAAKAAGKIQLDHFDTPLKKTPKSKMDFATHVDFECEDAIVSVLQKAFPDYGLLAEERGEIASDSDYRWIVDPLDGTILYASGVPASCVLIALQKESRIELGVMYRPFSDDLFFAQRKKGSFWNGRLVRVSKRTDLDSGYHWYSGMGRTFETRPEGIMALLRFQAYKQSSYWNECVAQLLKGNADLILGGRMHLWDRAAPSILISEAGGSYSGFSGETDLRDMVGVVAANPRLQKKAVAVLNSGGKPL